MNRVSILNALAVKNNYKSYLEVGVRNGDCFNAVTCEHKIGVDPDLSSAATVFKTSDEFFETNETMFDLIFIDGLHESEQVKKDIANSLKFLSFGGTILMHDCLPYNEWIQVVPQQPEHDEWCGDTWKAFVHYRGTDPNLIMHVIDSDYGCGILTRGKQELISIPETLTYADFTANKQNWMQVISVSEFMQKYLV